MGKPTIIITKNSCYDNFANQNKRRGTKTMFKKASIVTVLSSAFLLGGTLNTSVEASANTDNTEQSYNDKYAININDRNIDKKSFDCLQNYEWVWNIEQHSQKGQDKADKDNAEQGKEQPEKQEDPVQQDQSAQEAEKPTQQEQPSQEAGAPAQQQEQQENKQEQTNQNQQLNEFEQEVVELTNDERVKQGLDPLKIDEELSKVAREKSRDMADSNYFSHDSPNYGSPFDMMKSFGIDYRTAGENNAKGQRTPAEVVNGWMNSDGHRANILNEDFTHIGVGYVEQGNHWTQQFIGK